MDFVTCQIERLESVKNGEGHPGLVVKDFTNFLYGSFDTEVVARSFLHEQNQWESIFKDDRDPFKHTSLSYAESSKALRWVKVM